MDPVLPLLGLREERERLKKALIRHESLLVLGPAGAGKTALIRATTAELPVERGIVHARYSANLHRLLGNLARALLAARHGAFERLAKPSGDVEEWLCKQTSVHLKGLLWMALETQPLTIVLDGADGASFPIYRFFQRLYFAPGMAFIAAARDTASLGALSRLFWDPRAVIHIRPLNRADSEQLFDLAARKFELERFELDDFREKVLESAQGNPGQIVEMCRLAANPLYVSGRYIKFAPLRIDVMMRFLSSGAGHRPR
jgi:hypothetical protein